MGMFDNVVVKYKINGNYQNTVKEWQTKDLDCGLDRYTITEDGKLWKETNPLGDPKVIIPERFCYNGTINFYGSDKNKVWIDCKITFEDGVVVPGSVVVLVDDEEI